MEEPMTRDEILSRYRSWRRIGTDQQTAAVKLVSHTTLMQMGKRLGVVSGRALVLENESEMALMFDLAVYSRGSGGSSAMERYARLNPPTPGSDEAVTLNAKLAARFSIWRVERRHDVAGLIISDMISRSGAEEWLVDEALEVSASTGMLFASRLAKPDSFAMTCGVLAPIASEALYEMAETGGRWMFGNPDKVGYDPHFAAAVYRAAVRTGAMETVAFA